MGCGGASVKHRVYLGVIETTRTAVATNTDRPLTGPLGSVGERL